MKNIELYKDKLSKLKYFDDAYDFAEKNGMKKEFGCSAWSDIYNWLNTEHQILDDVEKRYLKNIIRPFREQVSSIVKGRSGNREFIIIHYIEDGYTHYIFFPSFKKGTMYKGMEPTKDYTLEELGL